MEAPLTDVKDNAGRRLVQLRHEAQGRYALLAGDDHQVLQVIGYLLRAPHGGHLGTWGIKADPWTEKFARFGDDMLVLAVEHAAMVKEDQGK